MILLVTGDRDWGFTGRPNEWEVLDYIDHVWLVVEVLIEFFLESPTVIHGNARGLDSIAGYIAEQLGYKVISVPAKWRMHGKAAGPIRNKEMLDMGPDYVIAFHDDLERSKGTKNCVLQAERLGLKVLRVSA